VRREEHDVPQLRPHAIVGSLVDEEPLQSLVGDCRLDRAGVASSPRGAERFLVKVAGEDLDRDLHLPPLRLFKHDDRDAVGFLAGGAPGGPGANALVRWLVEQRGDDLSARISKAGASRKNIVTEISKSLNSSWASSGVSLTISA
jgi:hypothetical protein